MSNDMSEATMMLWMFLECHWKLDSFDMSSHLQLSLCLPRLILQLQPSSDLDWWKVSSVKTNHKLFVWVAKSLPIHKICFWLITMFVGHQRNQIVFRVWHSAWQMSKCCLSATDMLSVKCLSLLPCQTRCDDKQKSWLLCAIHWACARTHRRSWKFVSLSCCIGRLKLEDELVRGRCFFCHCVTPVLLWCLSASLFLSW